MKFLMLILLPLSTFSSDFTITPLKKSLTPFHKVKSGSPIEGKNGWEKCWVELSAAEYGQNENKVYQYYVRIFSADPKQATAKTSHSGSLTRREQIIAQDDNKIEFETKGSMQISTKYKWTLEFNSREEPVKLTAKWGLWSSLSCRIK